MSSIQKSRYLILLLLMAIFVASAGCLGQSIGDVTYKSSALQVVINSEKYSNNTNIQVTVFDLDNFQQKELMKVVNPVDLGRGVNIHTVPMDLSPGSYKLFIYLIEDGKRTNCEIRTLDV